MDALEKRLNSKEPQATAILATYHKLCLENGEPPAYLREPVDRILALIFDSARKDYPYKVLFNRAHLASTSPGLSDDDLKNAPGVARQVAFEAAERALRSDRRRIRAGRKRTSLANHVKTEMRLVMRRVCEQYGVPITRPTDSESEDDQPAPDRNDVPDYWDNAEDVESRRSGGQWGGVFAPVVYSGTGTKADFQNMLLTPEDRERIDRERDEDAEVQRRTIAWVLGLKRRMGNFTVDDYDRRRIVELAQMKLTLVRKDLEDEEAARDPFDVAIGLVAQDRLAEGAAILQQSQQVETAELKTRALVVLDGGRGRSAAERQRRSRARKAAELIESSAVDTSQRVFEPEPREGAAD